MVFDPTQKYHGATITQAAYRAAIIESGTAVGSRPDSTATHVVNSVKILPDSILFVNFHHFVFVHNDYSSCFHHSGLETASVQFVSPPTFPVNATPSAIVVRIA